MTVSKKLCIIKFFRIWYSLTEKLVGKFSEFFFRQIYMFLNITKKILSKIVGAINN